MEVLAAQAGLELEEIVWDSDEFQFWGSEQYLRDIPLTDAASYGGDLSKSIFSLDDMKSFRARANQLNALKLGDQAAFYLSRRREA
jgi:hypothetical protein